LYYIVQQVQAHKMPLDIALLPVVESAFDPFAYSYGRAAGLWQFVPATGHIYELKQDWWYDGRRDLAASTRAALDYLNDLHT
jgi:membrane-bound lytic murein transglycosylase D